MLSHAFARFFRTFDMIERFLGERQDKMTIDVTKLLWKVGKIGNMVRVCVCVKGGLSWDEDRVFYCCTHEHIPTPSSSALPS